MPNFEVTLQRTTGASTSNSVGSVIAQTSGLRRFKVYSMTFSSEATPAEVAVLWQAGRITTAGTATSVTPKPKDLADAASSALGQQIHTSTEPTYTAGENMYTNAVHQRATVRWIARDDQDMIVCPATNAFGLGFKTPTVNGGTPNLTLDVGFIE
jgi:hypothetical protein